MDGSTIYDIPLELQGPVAKESSIYYWVQEERTGLLRFLRCGDSLYVISAHVPREEIARTFLYQGQFRYYYAKVDSPSVEEFKWTFRTTFGQEEDSNQALLFGDDLVGEGLYLSILPNRWGKKADPFSYTWQGSFVDEALYESMPWQAKAAYLALESVSEEEFCAALARGWPDQGSILVLDEGPDISLPPVTTPVPLQEFFPKK